MKDKTLGCRHTQPRDVTCTQNQAAQKGACDPWCLYWIFERAIQLVPHPAPSPQPWKKIPFKYFFNSLLEVTIKSISPVLTGSVIHWSHKIQKLSSSPTTLALPSINFNLRLLVTEPPAFCKMGAHNTMKYSSRNWGLKIQLLLHHICRGAFKNAAT